MIELSQQSGDEFKMRYGGDTLNTAIYLSRCGGQADYFSALGADPYSKKMLSEWSEEGVGIGQVKINKNALPGVYIINNDDNGERSFHYWRQNSPARTLISDFPGIFDELKKYEVIFLSGITLSLYSQDDLRTLFNFLSSYREMGGLVVFDNNYRARNWESIGIARQIFLKMMYLTDIALISFDDEKLLYGAHTIESCIDKWVNAGAVEIVLKNGSHGCHIYKNERHLFYPVNKILKPIDTTAAGDSFNGAYLAAKFQGKDIEDCITAGQECASVVIMHKGAIINRNISLACGDS